MDQNHSCALKNGHILLRLLNLFFFQKSSFIFSKLSWWSQEFKSLNWNTITCLLKIHSNIKKGGSWRMKKTRKIKTSYNSIGCNSLFSLHFYYIFSITIEAFYYITNRLLFWSASRFFWRASLPPKGKILLYFGRKNQLHYKEQEILHRIWCLLPQRWFNYLSCINQEHTALSHSVQNKEKEACSPRATRGYLTIIERSAEFSLHGRCNLEFP